MPITLNRSICCDLHETSSREWLVTNEIGGYAAGTVAGMLTRMQHGLLVASLPDVVTPQLLLAKIDEEVVFDQRTYYLGTNEYQDKTLKPAGFVHLESFSLEEGFPVFTYHLGGINGIVLEKRIWMHAGHNTTYIQYRILRTVTVDESSRRRKDSTTGALSNGSGYGRYYEYAEAAQRALTLTLLPFAAYRPYDQPQCGNNNWHFQVQQYPSETMFGEEDREHPLLLPRGVTGCTIRARDDAHPYHLLAIGHPESQVTFLPTGVWYSNFLHRRDEEAGRPSTDDLYLPGVIRATLWPDENATLTIIVSTEEFSRQTFRPSQLAQSYKGSIESQKHLLETMLHPRRHFGEGGETAQARRLQVLPLTTISSNQHEGGEEFLAHLLQATARFLTRRQLPHRSNSVLRKPESIPVLRTQYYEAQNTTRDTLIALPWLTLVTGHFDEARQILYEVAQHFKQGLLPSHVPRSGHPPNESDYSSVDTTLWYFYALDAYLRASHNYEFLDDMYYLLAESINWYTHGTLHGIQVDPTDGLLRTQAPSQALTWMNAVIGGSPVTPRTGKAVEVNALWYSALSLMHEWSQRLYDMHRLDHFPASYQEMLMRCKDSFEQRFCYARGGYLYDVIDGPTGDDSSIRPNQLLAISLRHPLLNEAHRKSVLDVVTQHLLTPYGLRTLARQEYGYRGTMGTRQDEQQQALHQGSVWSWLIGPYLDAVLTSYYPTAHKVSSAEILGREYLWRKGLQLLEPFQEHFHEGVLGMVSGVFDGDKPHKAGYKLASALATGELMHVYSRLAEMYQVRPEYVLSSQ